MMHYTHTPGGIFAVAAFYSLVPPANLPTLAMGLICGGVGGLLPDIDHSNSKITRSTGFVGSLLSKIFPHRGITHAPFFWILLWVALHFTLPAFSFVFFPLLLGCLSHIFLDALTPKGVPVFLPFHKKYVNLSRITTGGKLEYLVCALLHLGWVYLSFQLL